MAKKDTTDVAGEMRAPAALNTVPGDPALFGEPDTGISDEEELELVPKPEGLKRKK